MELILVGKKSGCAAAMGGERERARTPLMQPRKGELGTSVSILVR